MRWRRPTRLWRTVALCVSGTLLVLGALAALVRHLDAVELSHCLSEAGADPLGTGSAGPTAVCRGWEIHPSPVVAVLLTVVVVATVTVSVILAMGLRGRSTRAAASPT